MKKFKPFSVLYLLSSYGVYKKFRKTAGKNIKIQISVCKRTAFIVLSYLILWFVPALMNFFKPVRNFEAGPRLGLKILHCQRLFYTPQGSIFSHFFISIFSVHHRQSHTLTFMSVGSGVNSFVNVVIFYSNARKSDSFSREFWN